jgi:hypothetical protein
MKKYEYKIFDIDKVQTPEEEFVNQMGKKGWELILINNEPVGHFPKVLVKLYFKREII